MFFQQSHTARSAMDEAEENELGSYYMDLPPWMSRKRHSAVSAISGRSRTGRFSEITPPSRSASEAESLHLASSSRTSLSPADPGQRVAYGRQVSAGTLRGSAAASLAGTGSAPRSQAGGRGQGRPRGNVVCRKLKQVMTSSLGLFLLIQTYLCLGAFCFMWLETAKEEEQSGLMRTQRAGMVRNLVKCKDNATCHEEVLRLWEKSLLKFPQIYLELDGGRVWNWIYSYYCGFTIISTIGYGNVTPLTVFGRLFAVVYAVVGIPLMLLFITDIGNKFARWVKIAIIKFRKWEYKLRNRYREAKDRRRDAEAGSECDGKGESERAAAAELGGDTTVGELVPARSPDGSAFGMWNIPEVHVNTAMSTVDEESCEVETKDIGGPDGLCRATEPGTGLTDGRLDKGGSAMPSETARRDHSDYGGSSTGTWCGDAPDAVQLLSSGPRRASEGDGGPEDAVRSLPDVSVNIESETGEGRNEPEAHGTGSGSGSGSESGSGSDQGQEHAVGDQKSMTHGSSGDGQCPDEPSPDTPQPKYDTLLPQPDAPGPQPDSLRSPSDSLRQQSDSLRPQSDSLRSPSDSLRSPSDSLRSPSDSLRQQSDSLRPQSDSLRSPSDSLRSPSDSLRRQSDSPQSESQRPPADAIRPSQPSPAEQSVCDKCGHSLRRDVAERPRTSRREGTVSFGAAKASTDRARKISSSAAQGQADTKRPSRTDKRTASLPLAAKRHERLSRKRSRSFDQGLGSLREDPRGPGTEPPRPRRTTVGGLPAGNPRTKPNGQNGRLPHHRPRGGQPAVGVGGGDGDDRARPNSRRERAATDSGVASSTSESTDGSPKRRLDVVSPPPNTSPLEDSPDKDDDGTDDDEDETASDEDDDDGDYEQVDFDYGDVMDSDEEYSLERLRRLRFGAARPSIVAGAAGGVGGVGTRVSEADIAMLSIPLWLALLLLLLYLFAGAGCFAAMQSWSFLDGFYYCFISLSTIGFGDLVFLPQSLHAGLVFSFLYAFMGLCFTSMCMSLSSMELTMLSRRISAKFGVYRGRIRSIRERRWASRRRKTIRARPPDE